MNEKRQRLTLVEEGALLLANISLTRKTSGKPSWLPTITHTLALGTRYTEILRPKIGEARVLYRTFRISPFTSVLIIYAYAYVVGRWDTTTVLPIFLGKEASHWKLNHLPEENSEFDLSVSSFS